MDPLQLPYHHYLFFDVRPSYYRQSAAAQQEAARELCAWLEAQTKGETQLYTYATRGFMARGTFMVWVQAPTADIVPELLGSLYRTVAGHWLRLTDSRFGMVRPSQYSGRTGKPNQEAQRFGRRLAYFIVYPFTKTVDWHLLPADVRRRLMAEHINVGVQYPRIRQCLLYSYGVGDDEFIVSYETDSLEEFQDLVIALRRTEVRRYTARDTPVYMGIYKTPQALAEWL